MNKVDCENNKEFMLDFLMQVTQVGRLMRLDDVSFEEGMSIVFAVEMD
jgi:hypothetical protein